MKRKILGSFTASLIAILGTLIYSSCGKIDTTDLGGDLIPAVDNVKTFDTILPVISNNILDTDTTTMIYSELHSVGIIENDIEFGRTATHFYTSFVPSAIHAYPFVKKDSVVIDSVVLSLAYGGLYGDSNSVQQFEIREINPIFKFKDTAHRLDIPDLPVRPDLIGSASVYFYQLNNAVTYKNLKDTVNTSNELRIKLDTGWARRFISYDTTPGNAYHDDSSFHTKFRGLEIKPSESSPVKRGLAYFSLIDNDQTRITFYCRVQVNGKTDTIAPYFMYRSGDAEANIVRRTNGNGYETNLNNGTDNDQFLYLQTTPGSHASVSIPALSVLENRVIHRAELIIERAPSQEQSFYPPPANMFVEAESTTGDSILSIRNDFILTNASPGYDRNSLGGVFSKDNKYVFNITRYVQSLITKGFPNYKLRISSSFVAKPYFVNSANIPVQKFGFVINPFLAGGRVVVYGGAHPDTEKRMRLHIIYSKI